MVLLPPPDELERICKGLATLDAILSEEWASRYYSFNAAWDSKRDERMASMRNGEGDQWFIVFAPKHAFVKAYWHEYKREDPAAIYEGLPMVLEHQRKEPAFSVDDVTFGGWHEPGSGWTLRGNAKPLAEEMTILTGDPEAYRSYAASYFEVDVPLDAIAHVLAGRSLDAALVSRVAEGRTLASLKNDLKEIGY
jgi:hypothetical protein